MKLITEANVEQAGLAWFAGAGWHVAHGPDIASDALAELNPALPAGALHGGFRELIRPKSTE